MASCKLCGQPTEQVRQNKWGDVEGRVALEIYQHLMGDASALARALWKDKRRTRLEWIIFLRRAAGEMERRSKSPTQIQRMRLGAPEGDEHA